MLQFENPSFDIAARSSKPFSSPASENQQWQSPNTNNLNIKPADQIFLSTLNQN